MENFELFFGCLGNGTTVCDKAVEENGDYKKVAHISNGGNIKLYVSKDYIPAESMKAIVEMANKEKERFRSKFEKLSELEQYSEILDNLPLRKFLDTLKDKRPLTEKFPEIRQYYYDEIA